MTEKEYETRVGNLSKNRGLLDRRALGTYQWRPGRGIAEINLLVFLHYSDPISGFCLSDEEIYTLEYSLVDLYIRFGWMV